MLKALSLFAATILFIGLVVFAVAHKEGESWKPALGYAWYIFVFVSAYFGLRELERWAGSKEIKEASQEYRDLVRIGMSAAEAERLLQERIRLLDVSDRRYFGGRYKGREFRVAEFDGRRSRIRLLSIEGKVFEIQSEPKR